MTLRVLGIDPSLTGTGLALPDGSVSTIRPKSSGDNRLDEICRVIYPLAKEADLAVIEDLPMHAQAAGLVGMVQGVIRLALIRAGCPFAVISPASLKKYATGKGNATKPDMRMALFTRGKLDLRDDNQTDAKWLWLMGMDWLGQEEIKMPAAQRESIAKGKWPVRVAKFAKVQSRPVEAMVEAMMPTVVSAAICTGCDPVIALRDTLISSGIEPNGPEIRAAITAGQRWLWQHRTELPFAAVEPNASLTGGSAAEEIQDE